jgi:hypothetical protein
LHEEISSASPVTENVQLLLFDLFADCDEQRNIFGGIIVFRAFHSKYHSTVFQAKITMRTDTSSLHGIQENLY